MFDPNRSDNVISIEFPNQIADGKIEGSPFDHLYSSLRESFRLSGDEQLEDYVSHVITGVKSEATSFVTDLALKNSEYTSDDWKNAYYNNDYDTLEDIEDEFAFEVIVDIPPTDHGKKMVREKNPDKYENEDGDIKEGMKDKLQRNGYKEAIKLRHRNVYDPDRTNDLLDKHDIDRVNELVVLSDGTTGTTSLVQQAMHYGTDVSTVAFNNLVENPPEHDDDW